MREERQDYPNSDPERTAEAREAIANHDIPELPPVWAIEYLQRLERPPFTAGERAVVEASITRGDPQHGALRSDDHLSDYEVVVPQDCPECGHDRAIYAYHAYHHIAGSAVMSCRNCSYEHHAEEWG